MNENLKYVLNQDSLCVQCEILNHLNRNYVELFTFAKKQTYFKKIMFDQSTQMK